MGCELHIYTGMSNITPEDTLAEFPGSKRIAAINTNDLLEDGWQAYINNLSLHHKLHW